MILTILRILYLRLRNNPLELVLVFVMPVIFFNIFAAIFSSGISSGSDRKLRVGWVSTQSTGLATELRGFLDANTSLECSSLPALDPAEVTTAEGLDGEALSAQLSRAQQSGRYDLIVKLPVEFPETLSNTGGHAACLVSFVTDGQNPMAVAMVTSIVKGFFAQKQAAFVSQRMMQLHSGEGALPPGKQSQSDGQPAASDETLFSRVAEPSEVFAEMEERLDLSPILEEFTRFTREVSVADPKIVVSNATVTQKANIPTDETFRIIVETPQADTQENPRIAMYAAGIAVLFLLFSATGHAASLLEEAESGTLDRILVSRAGLFQIICGKWVGIFVMGCLQITIMFLWAEAVFHIQLGKHFAGFCIMTTSTAAATASFAMCMATMCKSRSQLNAVSVVLILSMSAVGGSMIPRFVMSDRMKDIGKWSFNAWALDGYQKVFWYQSPLSSLRVEVTVLLGSALVLGLFTLLLSGRWKRG
jgi:ABC-2 type transport system permease protein